MDELDGKQAHMTKIDPTTLIAEAQARETALKVACDRINQLHNELRVWRFATLVIAFVAVFAAVLA